MLRSFVVGAGLLALVGGCTTAESTPPMADTAPLPTPSSTLGATTQDGARDRAVDRRTRHFIP